MPPFLLLIALAGPASGSDTWSTPYTGVRYLKRTSSEPWRIHALEVDLCARGVSLRATTESERQRTTSSFGSAVGAQGAINGDFYSYYWPIGMAIGNSSAWNADNGSLGFITFGRNEAWIDEPTSVTAAASWMEEAVGGYPLLVRDGAALTSFSPAPDHCSSRHPRTAVGLSEDRQALYMVVVDGRSSSSVGMTCGELASLMAGLGAHTALNLDGGGSSTIWLASSGVLNSPSDGSERTVSNHLGVRASGSGAPRSCDFWMNELIVQAGVLDEAGTTDLDGDGLADACARAAAGLHCHLSTGDGFGDRWTIEDLSSGEGWAADSRFATIRTGDVNGDGLADVCARSGDGIRCWPSTGGGFGEAIDGPELSDGSGWAGFGYFTSIRLADVDGDGMDDLCARGASGFRCYLSTGDGFGERIEGPALSDGGGWNQPRYHGTIRTGDVNGDGLQDVCARDSSGVSCWLSDGAGFPTVVEGPAWSDGEGWDHVSQWSTIRLVDLDGDGMADLCGRSADGIRCHLSTGTAFGEVVEGPALSDASGWGDHSNYATIRMADLDGDGALDICARADAGVRCWLWEGQGFAASFAGPELSDAAGWNDHRYYTTFRLADMNGDGMADLCARGPEGFSCWLGPDLAEEVEGPEWSDSSGWDGLSHYSTIRMASRPPAPAEEDTGEPEEDDLDTGDGLPGVRLPPPIDGCGCGGGRGAPAMAALLSLALAVLRGGGQPALERPGRTSFMEPVR